MPKYQNPAEVRVFTVFRARQNKTAKVEALCREIVERAGQESVCARAEFLRDAEEDNVYVVTIRCATITDLERYLQLPWRRELVGKLLCLLEEEPERRLLEAVTPAAVTPAVPAR